jgi:hypothetical protein
LDYTLTRQILDYEFTEVIENSQQLIDEEILRFENIDKSLLKKDFNSLANAVFGTICCVYLCRYCMKVMEVMAMVEPSPDLLFRNKKIEELCEKFNTRYLKAIELYNKYTPSEVGQDVSIEKLNAIHLQASERYGSKKYDMDIDN